eukprot:6180083-Pleurochrysis_carterae.AAC.7
MLRRSPANDVLPARPLRSASGAVCQRYAEKQIADKRQARLEVKSLYTPILSHAITASSDMLCQPEAQLESGCAHMLGSSLSPTIDHACSANARFGNAANCVRACSSCKPFKPAPRA